jgi:signal peptidase I
MDATKPGPTAADKLFPRWSRRCPGLANRLRCLDVLVLLICGGVLMQTFGLEPFQVPTGSMAPALVGHHRTCICPHCGMAVAVGRPPADRSGNGGERFHTRAFCPNCGEQPLDTQQVPETAGDQVLVNKAAFSFRGVRRWEVVVLRFFGRIFIKRVVGLPGETIVLRDGDVYMDGRLARKSFAQARAMRVLVFDQERQPPEGWRDRWERQPDTGTDEGTSLLLDERSGRQTLTYHNIPRLATTPSGARSDDSRSKYPPLCDEYAYNGGLVAGSEAVHDFLIEADVELLAGQGTFMLRLCDGEDWVEVALPVGRAGPVELQSWPAAGFARAVCRAGGEADSLLQPGRRHHVEMAFVDRRVNVSVDGRPVVEDADLPEPKSRSGVSRPVQFEAKGAALVLRNFRLHRDVHYTQSGNQAVGAEPVRLGVEQYFVLGDNSPNSQDSRFWPQGAVSAGSILGPAFLVHLPSRPMRWQYAGGSWLCQLPDVERIRRIR